MNLNNASAVMVTIPLKDIPFQVRIKYSPISLPMIMTIEELAEICVKKGVDVTITFEE